MNEIVSSWTVLPIHFYHFEKRGMLLEEYEAELTNALNRAKETMLEDWGISTSDYDNASEGSKLQLSLQFLTCYEFLSLQYKIISDTMPFSRHESRKEVTLEQNNESWERHIFKLKNYCYKQALDYAKKYLPATEETEYVVLPANWN
jgi:hypothetical protein